MGELTSRLDLVNRSSTIRTENAPGANTAERVGSLTDDLLETLFLKLEIKTEATANTDLIWGRHLILEESGNAETVTLETVVDKPLQACAVLENYSGQELEILLTDGEFRASNPPSNFMLEIDGKVFVQITGPNKISIVGV